MLPTAISASPPVSSALASHSVREAAPARRFSVELGEVRPAASAPARPAGPLTPSVAPAPPAAADTARHVLSRLLADERAVDRGLAHALAGGAMSPRELLALQVNVIRYSQELEIASRLVEKVTGAVRQTLQTQV